MSFKNDLKSKLTGIRTNYTSLYFDIIIIIIIVGSFIALMSVRFYPPGAPDLIDQKNDVLSSVPYSDKSYLDSSLAPWYM